MNKLLIVTGPNKSGKVFLLDQLKYHGMYVNIDSFIDDYDFEIKPDGYSESLGNISALYTLSNEVLPNISLNRSYPYYFCRDLALSGRSKWDNTELKTILKIEKMLNSKFDVRIIVLIPQTEYLRSNNIIHPERTAQAYRDFVATTKIEKIYLFENGLIKSNQIALGKLFRWLKNTDAIGVERY